MNVLQALIGWASRRPGAVLALVAGLSLLAVAQLFSWPTLTPKLSLDAGTDNLLPQDDRDRQIFERVRNTFSDYDAVLMSVRLEPMFTVENMANLDKLTRALQRMPGVKSVFSLATAPNVLTQSDELEISSFTAQAREDAAALTAFPAQIAANPIYKGLLVSDDGAHTALAIALDQQGEAMFAAERYADKFRKLAEDITGSPQIWLTGSPVIQAETTAAMMRTLSFSLPITYLIVIVLLYGAYRSVWATVAVVLTISVALLWTAAWAAVLGMSLNLVTIITPPLIVTLGLAYAIHLLSDYYSDGAQDLAERARRARQVMNRVGLGMLLAGGTSIAGFLALTSNDLPAIRQFAVLSSIGVGSLFFLVVFFLPALLDRFRCGSRSRDLGRSFFDSWTQRFADFDIKWRRWIIRFALVLVALNLWWASGLSVGTDYIKSFREGNQVRAEYEAINETFDGANTVSVLIETFVDDALTNPELVHGVEELQTWLRAQPEVGQAVSYVDHLKLLHQSINNGDPAYHSIPEDSAAIKQLLVFAGGDEIHRVIDSQFQSALISLRIKVGESGEITRFTERVEARLAQLQPPLNGSLTGTPVLATRTVNAIGRGQWMSLAIAAFVIWAMLALMFTSVRAGLWALLPNLVPVSIYFGMLRLLDIPLNPTNSLIASIVLGVAVDDTVHFLTRFNRDARATGSEAKAVRSALRETIQPTTLTTVALCLGLLALTGSELRNQVQFGLLASFTLLMAWVSEVTLTPALGSRLRIVTLWDLLRLDLGPSPQHTIPLLSGLSLRQARIFALMSKIETYEAGDKVIQEGDFARDMYVIVDGSLQVWIERPEEHKVLATLGRGAVMGEAGFFGQRRTANVSAVKRARLLRFDANDLERLRRRYPWIAATVFRNLNRVQAERLARTTAMIQ